MGYKLNKTRLISSQGNVIKQSDGTYFITIHDTGNTNSTAQNNADYFNREWANVQAFSHVIVDDKQVNDIYPAGQIAWTTGKVNKYAFLQVEICGFTNDDQSKQSIQNAIDYVRLVIKDNPDKKFTIISHDEANKLYGAGTDHTDPTDYFARFGYTMDWFRNEVTKNSSDNTTTNDEKKEGEEMRIIKIVGKATLYLVRTTGVTSLTAQEWIGVKRVYGFTDKSIDTVNQAEFDGIKSALKK